jgi:flagellar protein FlaI
MAELKTLPDRILDAVKANPGITLDRVAAFVSVDVKTAEKWVKSLEELIKIDYPVNIMASPRLTPKAEAKPPESMIKPVEGGRKIESYTLNVHGVVVGVNILYLKGEVMNTYSVTAPAIGEATEYLLEKIISELAVKAPIELEEISDPKRMQDIKNKFREDAKTKIMGELPVTDEQAEILAGLTLHKLYGLDEIELLLGDDNIEDICINSSQVPLIVYHRKYGWLKTNLFLREEKDVFDIASQIGRNVGREITNLNPIMDARLVTGDRVASTLFPVSSQGNTLTIRRFARKPWTIIDFISPEYNTLSSEIAAFLWMCIQYELSIMVAGGTASGKTSLLNTLCAFIPPGQRIISIEDTREIQLPEHLGINWIQLTTRNPNPEGLGGVSMLDLMLAALRMRPDRVIVGEIRTRAEAEVLFEAMHTGHSVYSTMHADTCMHVKRRLVEPPISIPETELEILNLSVAQYRDRVRGIRRTFEVTEVIPGTTERKLELNYLFRWRVKADNFERIATSKRIYNDLNLYTGMSVKAIEEDLADKKMVLEWLRDNKVREMNEIGRVINMYYLQPDELMKHVGKAGRKK